MFKKIQKKSKSIIFFILILFCFDSISAQTQIEKKQFNKSLSLYQKKEYKKAYKGFKNFLKKYPSSQYLPDVYFYLALCETNYFSAILLYKKLIKKFRSHEKADNGLYRLAKLYFLHNNYTEAIRTFEKLIDNYKKSNYIYGSHYYLGLIHLIKNDINHAIESFDIVIKQKKKHKFHIESIIGKANCYFEKKKYDKSAYYFKKALKIKNKNYYPSIYLGLGNCYYKQKNYDKAYYYLRRAVKEFPGSPEYELAKEKIDFIKNNKTIFDQIDWSKFKAAERPEDKKPKKKYYTIQIASVKNKRFANAWRIKLKTTGYNAFSKTAKTDKGTFYRTYVGKYNTKAEAEKDKKTIKHKFKLDCIIVELK